MTALLDGEKFLTLSEINASGQKSSENVRILKEFAWKGSGNDEITLLGEWYTKNLKNCSETRSVQLGPEGVLAQGAKIVELLGTLQMQLRFALSASHNFLATAR